MLAVSLKWNSESSGYKCCLVEYNNTESTQCLKKKSSQCQLPLPFLPQNLNQNLLKSEKQKISQVLLTHHWQIVTASKLEEGPKTLTHSVGSHRFESTLALNSKRTLQHCEVQMIQNTYFKEHTSKRFSNTRK